MELTDSDELTNLRIRHKELTAANTRLRKELARIHRSQMDKLTANDHARIERWRCIIIVDLLSAQLGKILLDPPQSGGDSPMWLHGVKQAERASVKMGQKLRKRFPANERTKDPSAAILEIIATTEAITGTVHP